MMKFKKTHPSSKWNLYKIWSQELDRLFDLHCNSNYQLLSKLHLGDKMLETMKISGYEYEMGITDYFNLIEVTAIDSISKDRELVVRGCIPRLADNWFVAEEKLKRNVIFKNELSEFVVEKLKPKDLILVFWGRQSFNVSEKVSQVETNASSSSTPVHVIIYRPHSNVDCDNIEDYIKDLNRNCPHLQYDSVSDRKRNVIKIYPRNVMEKRIDAKISNEYASPEGANNCNGLEKLDSSSNDDGRCKWEKMSTHMKANVNVNSISSSESDIDDGIVICAESEDEQLPHIKNLKSTIQEDAKTLLDILASDEELEADVGCSTVSKPEHKNTDNQNHDSTNKHKVIESYSIGQGSCSDVQNVVISPVDQCGDSKDKVSRKTLLLENKNTNCINVLDVFSIEQDIDRDIEEMVYSLVDQIQFSSESSSNENAPVETSLVNLTQHDRTENTDYKNSCVELDANSDVENVVMSLVDRVHFSLAGSSNESAPVEISSVNVNSTQKNDGESTDCKLRNSCVEVVANSDVENVVMGLVDQVQCSLEGSSIANESSSESISSVNISLESCNSREEVTTPDFINYTLVRGSDRSKSTTYENYEDYDAQCKKFKGNGNNGN